ncbi:MAG: PPC domain-containing protein [Elainellaceae cyanobacterium]
MHLFLAGLSLATLLTLLPTVTRRAIAQSPDTQSLDAQSSDSPLLEVEGVLETGDAVLEQDGSLYDTYSFEGQAGQTVSILMESATFDPFIWLFSPQNRQLAQNDDFNTTTLSAGIVTTLPEDGTYVVVANAHDAENRGRYRLVVREVTQLD